MPDGEMEFSDRVRNSLQYDILMMLKASCESAMENHLLMRDLRVGKFAETFDGVTSIRNVYRSLQERLKDGRDMSLGRSSEELKLFLSSGAGDTILSAEALLDACKKLELKEEELEIEKTLQLAALAGENPDLCAQKNEGSDVSNYDQKDKNGFQETCCGEPEISSELEQLETETPILQIQQVLTQQTEE